MKSITFYNEMKIINKFLTEITIPRTTRTKNEIRVMKSVAEHVSTRVIYKQ